MKRRRDPDLPRRKTYRFGTKHRDYVYWRDSMIAHDAGAGPHPICPHCSKPVHPKQDWDDCHVGAPAALGGRRTAVGHRNCNRLDGATVVVPMVAKVKRMRAKHLGEKGPGLGPCPMRAGRRSGIRKTFAGAVVPRLTHGEKHAAMLAKRAITPVERPDV
jgi:hypothetical protein